MGRTYSFTVEKKLDPGLEGFKLRTLIMQYNTNINIYLFMY